MKTGDIVYHVEFHFNWIDRLDSIAIGGHKVVSVSEGAVCVPGDWWGVRFLKRGHCFPTREAAVAFAVETVNAEQTVNGFNSPFTITVSRKERE